jgi:hypothetical protein
VSLLSAVVAAVVVLVVKDLLKDELRGHVERMPHRLLRLARLRLPAELRSRLHDGEWLPELEHIWARLESVPLTRLVVGTRYALGLLRTAPRIARELGVTRRRHTPMTLLLLVGALGALLSLTTALGVFDVALGAIVSLLGGILVVTIVSLVMETTARDLGCGGRRSEP